MREVTSPTTEQVLFSKGGGRPPAQTVLCTAWPILNPSLEQSDSVRPRPCARVPFLERPGAPETAGVPVRPGLAAWDFEGNSFSTSPANWSTPTSATSTRVVQAIQDQAAVQVTLAPQHASLVRGQTARAIRRSPRQAPRCSSPTAGRTPRRTRSGWHACTGKAHKVRSFYRSYHGNTGAAINATGDPRRWPNEFAYGHVHFFGPYLYRSSFWSADEQQECERAGPPRAGDRLRGTPTPSRLVLRDGRGDRRVLVPPPGTWRVCGVVQQVRHRLHRRRGHGGFGALASG